MPAYICSTSTSIVIMWSCS